MSPVAAPSLVPALLALWLLACDDSRQATLPLVDRGGPARAHVGPAGSGGSRTDAGAPGSGAAGGAADAGGRGGADASVGGAGGGSGGVAGTDSGPDVVHADNGPGAIVAYDVGSTDKKLHVLDPETGRSLSSEPIGTVRAIVNDGAPYPTDRWYVFEQVDTVDRGVTLHVRRLDIGTGVFQELGALPNAPAVFGRPVTLGAAGKSFVAYLSEPASTKADLALTVIDTTDPAKPALVQTYGSLPSGAKVGLVADGDAIAVVAVQSSPCPAGPSGEECKVTLARAAATRSAVNISPTTSIVDKIGAEGNVDFAMDPIRHEAVIGFPPLAAPSKPTCGATSRSAGVLRTYSMTTATLSASVPIPMEAPRISGVTFDSCARVVFLTTLDEDIALWAIPLAAGGNAEKLCVANPGGPLFYDSSSHSLFRASTTGEIEAYRVEMAGSSPTLTVRTLDELPPGLRAGAMAVRSSDNPSCASR